MSVRVVIDVGIDDITIDRPTMHLMGDDEKTRVREALVVLDGIREDLARMVGSPAEPEFSSLTYEFDKRGNQ